VRAASAAEAAGGGAGPSGIRARGTASRSSPCFTRCRAAICRSRQGVAPREGPVGEPTQPTKPGPARFSRVCAASARYKIPLGTQHTAVRHPDREAGANGWTGGERDWRTKPVSRSDGGPTRRPPGCARSAALWRQEELSPCAAPEVDAEVPRVNRDDGELRLLVAQGNQTSIREVYPPIAVPE